MDNLTPLEAYVLARKGSFPAICSVIQSFSYPSQDEDACYFPSEAFVAALLAKQDNRICRLLSKSTLRGYVFKVAIYTKDRKSVV